MADDPSGAAPAPSPGLVLLCGPSCTGKTTLGTRLAADLGLPLFAKDSIKERLFDNLGWSDRAWSRRLGRASVDVLYAVMDAEMAVGRPLFVECNFSAELAEVELTVRLQRYGYRAFTIQCVCDGPTLQARWRERTFNPASGRHPGHVERECAEEFMPGLLRGRDAPLLLPGERVELDTTNFAAVEAGYAALRERVRAFLHGTSPSSAEQRSGGPVSNPSEAVL